MYCNGKLLRNIKPNSQLYTNTNTEISIPVYFYKELNRMCEVLSYSMNVIRKMHVFVSFQNIHNPFQYFMPLNAQSTVTRT